MICEPSDETTNQCASRTILSHWSVVDRVLSKPTIALIAPVDAASREIVRRELYTLADLQRMNQLEPDDADLERQARSQPRNGEN